MIIYYCLRDKIANRIYFLRGVNDYRMPCAIRWVEVRPEDGERERERIFGKLNSYSLSN